MTPVQRSILAALFFSFSSLFGMPLSYLRFEQISLLDLDAEEGHFICRHQILFDQNAYYEEKLENRTRLDFPFIPFAGIDSLQNKLLLENIKISVSNGGGAEILDIPPGRDGKMYVELHFPKGPPRFFKVEITYKLVIPDQYKTSKKFDFHYVPVYENVEWIPPMFFLFGAHSGDSRNKVEIGVPPRWKIETTRDLIRRTDTSVISVIDLTPIHFSIEAVK